MELRNDGLLVHAIENENRIDIGIIASMNQNNGVCGKYINELVASGKKIRFINVEDEILEGMLRRRGFKKATELVNLKNSDGTITTENGRKMWVYEEVGQK